MRVRVDFESVRPALAGILAYGIGRALAREYQIRFGRKMMGLGEFGGLPLSAAGIAVQFLTDIPYESDVKEVSKAVAFASLDDLVRVMIYDEPIGWFTDANTLVVRNLGAFSSTATNWKVLVDGNSVEVSAVEGDINKATLHLASAVSPGLHDVIVTLDGAKKALYAKMRV